MSETHYLISDASKKVDVESHVLRYWEEELEMNIPRNEMGHRYYTDFHIRLFKQIKELKEKGYQLKAIKTALAKTLDAEGESVAPTDVLEEDVMTALKECTEQEKRDLEKLDPGEAAELMNREKAEQFREFLTQMIGQAIEENNEKLSQDISRMVNDKVLKEIDYLMRVADERDEERFRQLDETIRLYQKENKGRAEAAAAKAPFLPSIFRKRKFGRNGNKLWIRIHRNQKAAVRIEQRLLCIGLRLRSTLVDCACRTDTSTSTAADASISVDYVLSISLGNSVYRTFTSTSTAANAAIANYICHDKIPPLFISFIL